MSEKYLEVFTQLAGVKGFFSTKYGTVDSYPYIRNDVFAENGLSDAIAVCPKQIHKDNIAIINEIPSATLLIPDTDGLITNWKNILLTTVHADCLAVFLYDAKKHAIGLVHAGWRGTALGIAPKAVKMMTENYGSLPEDVYAFISPGISKCCFEVGPEVYEEFKNKWDFIDDFAQPKNKKYYIDLKGINKIQLEKAGLQSMNIQISKHCTCCEPETFCSYRRDGGTYLRMGAGLCMPNFDSKL